MKQESKTLNRQKAREIAFKLIFEFTFNKIQNNNMFEEYTAGLDADSISYISEVYFGVASHYDELEEKISANCQNFAFDRLFKVDLALLLLSLYEITYMKEIPYKVSIDEALNLAEKYSSEKSTKYINGVLSKFSR